MDLLWLDATRVNSHNKNNDILFFYVWICIKVYLYESNEMQNACFFVIQCEEKEFESSKW